MSGEAVAGFLLVALVCVVMIRRAKRNDHVIGSSLSPRAPSQEDRP